jgi:ankyrin repeat protein
MLMSPTEAQRLVERLDLIGPCHGSVPGDYDRVTALFDAHPVLPAALNSLDPARIEETPQGAAAHLFCREILLYMLDQGVRLDLFMACALGQAETAGTFLRKEPAQANARGAHGIHVLNHAATTPIARCLLEHGADPNHPVYEPWSWTPLHEAAYRGKRALLELLVAAGGKLNASRGGLTPLHAAARMGHREVVEWLVERGVDLNARDPAGPWRGMSALTLADENGHAEIADFLRERGAVAYG